ncbi:high light inducible protein (nucleomorph) [Guillardia theta]|uniref:High light inducible protein n=1 Tax=Guillardia theta TaxID=55529 RepID=Q98RP5_GUITH|nr:high light inducible protein [Guillardia theta]AAK39901.1 high light inducible protein [Guillardia theta]
MINIVLHNFNGIKGNIYGVKNLKTIQYSTITDFISDDNNIPGKIVLSKEEISNREKKLKILAEKWKNERLEKEILENKIFGFSKYSEIINGRIAMFFITTGLLTELWTKQSLISQIEIMLRVLGIIN